MHRVVVWCAIAMLAASTRARADDAHAPWSVGVTAAQKDAAHALLDAGNALFLQRDYAGALEQYRKAVAQWDHPAIRFNIVRCLIQLDRSVEAADNLKLALEYGAAPLEDAVYSEALAYQKLLAKQIADVAVSCAQAGVSVSLDGQPLLACPGTQTRRVAPGRHQLVGSKDGFLTKTSDVVIAGGETQTVSVELVPLSAATISHRWAEWKPWVVLGSGLVVLGVGGLVEYQSSQDMAEFDREIAVACAGTGCGPGRPIPPSVASEQTRAKRENDIAIGVMSLGVAAAAAGGVLLYMNRGLPVIPTIEHTPGGGAVSVAGHF
jgi:PEGA domain